MMVEGKKLESWLGQKIGSRFDDLLEGRDQRKCKCVMFNIKIRVRVLLEKTKQKKKRVLDMAMSVDG